jgi:hypothetical protein
MAVNCREYLKGEIETLQPDIIVTQGARARNAMAWKFGTNHRVVMPGNPRHRAFHESVEMPMNLRAMKIVGWHPCAHWRRGEEEQFMDWAIESVQKVIPPAEWTRRHNVQETAPNV